MYKMLAVVGMGAMASVASATDLKIEVKATYLRTSGDPGAMPAQPIELATHGVASGGWLRVERLGFYKYGGTSQDNARALLGVFSSGPVLLAPSEPHRVPGALDKGCPYVTAPTWVGALTTDINEDFLIDDNYRDHLLIQVPATATHLFVSTLDSFYGDNADPNGDFGLRITASDGPCYPDCNADCELGVDDFMCFQTLFSLGDPYTDCDADGFLSIDDFVCFHTMFAIGC